MSRHDFSVVVMSHQCSRRPQESLSTDVAAKKKMAALANITVLRHLSQLHRNVLLNHVRPFSSFRFDLCFINMIHSDTKFQLAEYRILCLYMR